MKNLLKPLAAGIVGTSFMTLFSYWYSRKVHQDFQQQVLLTRLWTDEKQKEAAKQEKGNLAVGMAMHYAVGISFAYSYFALQKSGLLKQAPAKGIFLGAAYGAIGLLAWKVMFRVHPNPPKIPFKHFLTHLMLAHIVYGFFFTRVQDKLVESRINSK